MGQAMPCDHCGATERKCHYTVPDHVHGHPTILSLMMR
jgi:hypothetical protein